jgi:hypothetical protein
MEGLFVGMVAMAIVLAIVSIVAAVLSSRQP